MYLCIYLFIYINIVSCFVLHNENSGPTCFPSVNVSGSRRRVFFISTFTYILKFIYLFMYEVCMYLCIYLFTLIS